MFRSTYDQITRVNDLNTINENDEYNENPILTRSKSLKILDSSENILMKMKGKLSLEFNNEPQNVSCLDDTFVDLYVTQIFKRKVFKTRSENSDLKNVIQTEMSGYSR